MRTSDTFYAIPTRDWLTHALTGYFSKLLKEYGLKYQKESYDCDDFAITFAMEARRAHALTPSAPKDSSLAVGFFFFNSYGTEGIIGRHAATVALVGDENGLQVITMEPQTGRVTKLKAQERESCDFLFI